MIDIHTHILPDVDDGSRDLETSLEMIKQSISQGVTDLVATPHVQSVVTRATRTEHEEKFKILQEHIKDLNLKINLHLGAEVRYHSHIDTDYQTYTFGKNNYLLLEFSTRNDTPIEEICYDIMRSGFQVIVAHVERYQYVTMEDVIKIRATGALIQVNTTSVLGTDTYAFKRKVKDLLKYKLIDIISTDMHNLEKRPPNLLEARNFLKKYYKEEELDQLFNAIKL